MWTELTASLVDISIKENQGAANVKAAEKRRQEVEALAQAERYKQEAEGQGRAAAIRSVGEAEGGRVGTVVGSLVGVAVVGTTIDGWVSQMVVTARTVVGIVSKPRTYCARVQLDSLRHMLSRASGSATLGQRATVRGRPYPGLPGPPAPLPSATS